MNELEDLSPMPFGKHAGAPMQDVPADYLFYLWTNGLEKKGKDQYLRTDQDRVAAYIRSNLSHLEQEHPDGIWE